MIRIKIIDAVGSIWDVVDLPRDLRGTLGGNEKTDRRALLGFGVPRVGEPALLHVRRASGQGRRSTRRPHRGGAGAGGSDRGRFARGARRRTRVRDVCRRRRRRGLGRVGPPRLPIDRAPRPRESSGFRSRPPLGRQSLCAGAVARGRRGVDEHHRGQIRSRLGPRGGHRARARQSDRSALRVHVPSPGVCRFTPSPAARRPMS